MIQCVEFFPKRQKANIKMLLQPSRNNWAKWLQALGVMNEVSQMKDVKLISNYFRSMPITNVYKGLKNTFGP